MTADQATRALLDAMAASGKPPIHESTPEAIRAAAPQTTSILGAGPEMASVADLDATSSDGATFPVRVLVPSQTPQATVLYFHGGGWVLGDIDGFDTLGRTLAASANVTVVLVGYRLAPEHPFPTPVEDAWAAVQWADGARGTVAGIEGPLVLAGDSAGGNLSIVAALRAREVGPAIAATLLVYPATDSDTSRPSYVDPANHLLISKADMEWFYGHYLAGADRTHPDIAPILVEDLRGFPPTALALAEHDPLHDEGAAFGRRLREAGVAVEERLFAGQSHGFLQMVNVLPGSADGIAWLAGYLTGNLTTPRAEEDS